MFFLIEFFIGIIVKLICFWEIVYKVWVILGYGYRIDFWLNWFSFLENVIVVIFV